MKEEILSSDQRSTTAKVVVASTVMLSFISFWRAAAIVLSDLGSSVYYVGGIVEQAIGPAAPWFIIAVMLFSFAVRSIYMESSSMFVRGGVYVVVRDAMGPFIARLSVSALLFDYVLTGPISGVSAGQYLGRLVNETSELLHFSFRMDPAQFAVFFGIAVTFYFWWYNIKGLHESSTKALRIMQITTVMVVMFLIWCVVTLVTRGPAQLPPPPTPSHLQFSDEGLGWFKGTWWPTIPVAAVIIAFGHSVLSMSGFETLAQVYREIEFPKLKSLKITGNIVCIYATISTGGIILLASMIIPDAVRKNYVENLLGGLSMHLAGPELLRLAFHIFVVIVGVLILSGAVNTSLIGSNGVMNRVAEDGVLDPWFQKPHRRFGTTYRIINIVTILQILTVIASRGDTFTLVLFTIFTLSERRSAKKKKKEAGLEQFNLDMRPEITTDSIHVRPGCVLTAVRDYSRMQHLQAVLQKTNTRKHDIVVMTIRGVSTAGTGEYLLSENQLFTDYERELFTRVVSMAEKEGKPVELLTVPGVNPFDAMVHTAARLKASRLVSGVSARMDSEELARRIGKAWETSPEPRHPFSLEIISPDRPSIFVNLGPHPPRLWPEDVDLVHELWLELSDEFGSKLHHRDVLGVALRRMNKEVHSAGRSDVIRDVREELEHRDPKHLKE